MANIKSKKEKKSLGLGDIVEDIIETVVPKLAKKAKERGCNCEKKKIWLNNIGARFG